MRPQTEEDKLGWDLVNRFLHHLKHELAQDQPLRRRFVDCTREGPPEDDHLIPEDLNVRDEEPIVEEELAEALPDSSQQPQLAEEIIADPVSESPGTLPDVEDTPAMEQRGEVRAAEVDEHIERPRQRARIQVDEGSGGSFPFRGTSTAMGSRDPTPQHQWLNSADILFEEAKKGTVIVEDLPTQQHKDLFLKGSRLKESKAVEHVLDPLPAEEAETVLKYSRHLIIPSRWLDVYKEVEIEGAPEYSKTLKIPKGLQAKSRWILQGFHDASALKLNRSVNASAMCELLFVLQVIVDNKWEAFCGDIAAAFTQTDMSLPQNQRQNPVYVRAPSNGDLPSFPGVKLFLLKVELYGLMTGPLSWKNSLYSTMTSLGFVQHPLGVCTLLWYTPDTQELAGIVLLQVDDILGGGEHPGFKEAVRQLRQKTEKYRFGKWRLLSEGTEFNGRHLNQVNRGKITVDMKAFLHKIQPVPVNVKQEITTEVVTQYRGLVGSLSWATRSAMPQGAGDASILAGRTTTLMWADVKEANRTLLSLQQTAPTLQIVSMPREKSIMAFSDASLSNLACGRTQVSMVMGWVDTAEYRRSGTSTFSIQEWFSKKYSRVVSSTLCTEAAAASLALASAEWLQAWHHMCYDLAYELHLPNARTLELQHIEKELEPPSDKIILVTDSKSIYDVLKKRNVEGVDKRA
eukprot:6471060-Amphidinium_carterae.1